MKKDISYSESKQLNDSDIRSLYEAVGWHAYTQQFTNLGELMIASQLVYTAWDGNRLVGLIRTVGDGLSIQYVQDLLVLPSYQGQGIGTALLQYVLDNSTSIRQLVLITDGQEENGHVIEYYQRQGLTCFEEAGIVGLLRSNQRSRPF